MSFIKKIIQKIYHYLYNNYEIHIQSSLFNYGKVTYDGGTLVLITPTLSEYLSVEGDETKDMPLSRKFYGQSFILPDPAEVKKEIFYLDIFDRIYKGENGYYLVPSASKAKDQITVSKEGNEGQTRYIISLPIRKINYESYFDLLPIEILYDIALYLNIPDLQTSIFLDQLKGSYVFTWEKYFKDKYPGIYTELKDANLVKHMNITYSNVWEVLLDIMYKYKSKSKYNPKEKLLFKEGDIYYIKLDGNYRLNLKDMKVEIITPAPTTQMRMFAPRAYPPGTIVL